MLRARGLRSPLLTLIPKRIKCAGQYEKTQLKLQSVTRQLITTCNSSWHAWGVLVTHEDETLTYIKLNTEIKGLLLIPSKHPAAVEDLHKTEHRHQWRGQWGAEDGAVH